MATVTVRKFALSPDPDEVVDFTEGIDYFASALEDLGFKKTGTYVFRFSDNECMLKAELTPSKDGYYLWLYVQALDEHSYRLKEVAEAFGAHLVDNARRS